LEDLEEITNYGTAVLEEREIFITKQNKQRDRRIYKQNSRKSAPLLVQLTFLSREQGHWSFHIYGLNERF